MDLQKAWKEQPLTIGLLAVGVIIAVLLGVIAFKGSPPPPKPAAQPGTSWLSGFDETRRDREIRTLRNDVRRLESTVDDQQPSAFERYRADAQERRRRLGLSY